MLSSKSPVASPESHAFICRLFILTGGNGRRLTSFKPLPDDEEFGMELMRVKVPDMYYGDPALTAIMNEMVALAGESLLSDVFDPWECNHGIHRSRIITIITIHHGSHAVPTKLQQYRENSIIFEEAWHCEVYVPAVLIALAHELKSQLTRFETISMEGVLTGWSPDKCHTFPSAGHAIEDPLREMIVANNWFEVPSQSYSVDNKFTLDKNFHPSTIANKLVQGVSNFIGLDGFLFSCVDEGQYRIYVTSLKSGRLNLKTTRSEVQEYLRTAVLGIKKLLSMLLPGNYTITIEGLLFCTTKSIADSARALLCAPLTVDTDLRIYNVPVLVRDQDDFLNCLDDKRLSARLAKWIS
jgi:hypothetical protein